MAKNSENARNKSTNTTGSNMTGSNRVKNGFEENSTKTRARTKQRMKPALTVKM